MRSQWMESVSKKNPGNTRVNRLSLCGVSDRHKRYIYAYQHVWTHYHTQKPAPLWPAHTELQHQLSVQTQKPCCADNSTGRELNLWPPGVSSLTRNTPPWDANEWLMNNMTDRFYGWLISHSCWAFTLLNISLMNNLSNKYHVDTF